MTFRRTLIYSAAALLFLLGMRLATLAKGRGPSPASTASTAALVRDRLAPTLPPADFPKNPVAQHAYAAAARIAPLLSDLPCDCRCGSATAHSSLLGCFETRHAAHCLACQREDLYAFDQSREGKKPRQIRRGILRGAWRHVKLSPWRKPFPEKRAAIEPTRASAAYSSARATETTR